MSKILRVVKHAAASFASLLVQLFQMVLLKLGYEFKGTFSVVFLGLHTKPECACWALFILGTLVFSFYSLLPGLCLSPFIINYHSCATFFVLSLCFGITGIHTCEICVTVQIHVVVLTRKQQVMFKWRNLS